MSNVLKSFITAAIVCFMVVSLSSTSEAELISIDGGFGAGTATHDTSTGLDWLDISFTHLQTYNQVSSLLSTTYLGWRSPNEQEVNDLVLGNHYQDVDLLVYPEHEADNHAIVASMIVLFGYPGGDGGMWASYNGGVQSAYLSPDEFIRPHVSVGLDVSIEGYAHFLVRGNEPTPIPEPATMLLLGSGLIGLAGLRRKFRKS